MHASLATGVRSQTRRFMGSTKVVAGVGLSSTDVTWFGFGFGFGLASPKPNPNTNPDRDPVPDPNLNQHGGHHIQAARQHARGASGHARRELDVVHAHL